MFFTDHKARKRVADLEEDFLKLQREFKALEMEWSNAYDKLLTMMQRIAKRAEVLQKEMDGGKPPLSPSEQALMIDPEFTEPSRFLSPSQKRLQAQILRQRALRREKIASANPQTNGSDEP